MKTLAKRVLPAVGLASIAVLGFGTVPAAHGADDPDRLVIDGDLQIAPGIHVLNIDAEGTEQGDDTSGTYTATLMNGRSQLPFQIKGPVTCVETDDDAAALVYPISETAPNLVPAGLKDAFAVKISVRTGDTDKVGVMGPAPTDSFDGCDPGATPFDFDGDITIE